MTRLVLITVLSVAAMAAQGPGGMGPFPVFPAELQKFLELSSTQVDSIRRANLELDAYRMRKQIRMGQVQREIQEWTDRDPVDAMQLGVRYAELETIRREIREEETKTVAKVRGVLNAGQMAKLKVLEDAVKLQPLINDARCENLMTVQPGNVLPATRVTALPWGGCARALLLSAPADPGQR